MIHSRKEFLAPYIIKSKLQQARLYDVIISGKSVKSPNPEKPWMADAAGLPENALELLPKLVRELLFQVYRPCISLH